MISKISISIFSLILAFNYTIGQSQFGERQHTITSLEGHNVLGYYHDDNTDIYIFSRNQDEELVIQKIDTSGAQIWEREYLDINLVSLYSINCHYDDNSERLSFKDGSKIYIFDSLGNLEQELEINELGLEYTYWSYFGLFGDNIMLGTLLQESVGNTDWERAYLTPYKYNLINSEITELEGKYEVSADIMLGIGLYGVEENINGFYIRSVYSQWLSPNDSGPLERRTLAFVTNSYTQSGGFISTKRIISDEYGDQKTAYFGFYLGYRVNSYPFQNCQVCEETTTYFSGDQNIQIIPDDFGAPPNGSPYFVELDECFAVLDSSVWSCEEKLLHLQFPFYKRNMDDKHIAYAIYRGELRLLELSGRYTKFEGEVHFSDDDCQSQLSPLGLTKISVEREGAKQFFITNESGNYTSKISELGTYTVKLEGIDTSIFNVDPISIEHTATEDMNIIIQDFCISTKVEKNDLKLTMFSQESLRPGLESDITIICENLGSDVVSSMLVFDFPDNVLEVVSSVPQGIEMMSSQMDWMVEDLAPFEKRSFTISVKLNTPIDDNPLVGGEVLDFLAEISELEDEYSIINNVATIQEVVVNSYDPNDKRCLQGNYFNEMRTGEFLDFIIRFENTGTASAINVVVKDEINPDMFDINTVEVVSTSHDVEMNISNTDLVEFVFKDINLPFDDENNDGFIHFRIKVIENLELHTVLSNTAEIIFDFNIPIVTNTTETTIVEDQDGDGYHSIEDCDDTDPDINPNIEEVAYDGLDNDCDESTLDDDLDQDGFVLEDDCDDTDPDINPGIEEVTYDGLDNDCDESTLDDDLDQDGFVLEDDCDDTDPDINPNATEIPNNDIDEDCDGEDVITSTSNPILDQLTISPNPFCDKITIDNPTEEKLYLKLYNVLGERIENTTNSNKKNIIINTPSLYSGIYILSIQNETRKTRVVKMVK